MDPRYAPFWTKYAKDYMQQLKKYNFDQDSNSVMAWVKKFQTHDKDFAFHKNMTRLDGRETYGRCVLYSTCTGEKGVVIGVPKRDSRKITKIMAKLIRCFIKWIP